MPTERLSMRRIRQVLQLHFGVRASARVIARSVGAGRSTVQDYLARAAAAGLVWPLPAALTDEELEQLLFPSVGSKSGARRYVEPDWSALVREMKRPGLTSLFYLKNIKALTRMVTTGIRVFVSFSERLSSVCRRRCARATWPGIRCSSTIPARRCRSSTR